MTDTRKRLAEIEARHVIDCKELFGGLPGDVPYNAAWLKRLTDREAELIAMLKPYVEPVGDAEITELCPACGLKPDQLGIACDDHAKWAYAACPHCDFEVEFRNQYATEPDEINANAWSRWRECKRPLLLAYRQQQAEIERLRGEIKEAGGE